MKLLDSNILIYSFSDPHHYLRELVWGEDAFASEITRLETLGFHGLSVEEEDYYKDVFLVLQTRKIDRQVLDEAIRLRRTYRMKLGDSIIAATAVLNGFELYTRNMSDFEKIPGLKVVNPLV